MKRISAQMALRISSGSMSLSAQLAEGPHHRACEREESESEKEIRNVHRSLPDCLQGSEGDVAKV